MSDEEYEDESFRDWDHKKARSVETFHAIADEEPATHLDLWQLRDDLVRSGDLTKSLPSPGIPPITLLETSQGPIALSSYEIGTLSPGSEIKRLQGMVTRVEAEKFFYQSNYNTLKIEVAETYVKNRRMSERLRAQKRTLSMLEKNVKVPFEWATTNVEQLVEAVNLFSGPKVKRDPIRGWGLFADRDYKRGELITLFGGNIIYSAAEVQGDYVARCSEFYIDGFYGFRLGTEKGRWINEFNSEVTFINCSLGREIRAVVDVEEGDQFFCNYGKHYVRKY